MTSPATTITTVREQRTAGQAVARLRSPGFERWSELAAGCGHCARPVRLVGGTTTVDRRSGEVLSSYSSAGEPDGVLYVRCGNRRAAVCPSCSREYQGDMWHLLVAGAAGGSKGVPASIATHPLVFATLTAPSFGPVHSVKRGGVGSARCRPRRDKRLCAHGRATWCMAVHTDTDHAVGQPFCSDCYDYVGHVVWQWWAPELWRRFTIALTRRVAALLGCSVTAARERVRVQYAKVAEFQRRGIVHFHALIRLDGKPIDGDPYPPPAVAIDSTMLAHLVKLAASATTHTAPGVPGVMGGRLLLFGVQVDARPVRHALVDEATELTAEQVAGYIAKYATKAAEDVDPGNGSSNAHVRAIRDTIEILSAAALGADGVESPYALIAVKWRGMLGFRGHFASKSRSYSTTLTSIRTARRRWHRHVHKTDGPDLESVDLDADEDETTLVIGSWRFAGMGWLTDGDAALAAMAAAEAREYAKEQAQARRAQSGTSF